MPLEYFQCKSSTISRVRQQFFGPENSKSLNYFRRYLREVDTYKMIVIVAVIY
jgi:hypothetical protein